MKTRVIALWALLCFAGALAQDVSAPVPSADERAAMSQQLAARRQQLETDYNQAMTFCYQKFDVTSCRLEARERRLQAHAVLRKEEIAFNTVERRLKAEEAERRLAESNALAREREQTRQTDAADNAKAAADRAAQKQADHAAQGQQREAYDQKQRDAAQRRVDLEQKRRERAKPPSAALPPVTGSSQ
ncbi:hypothetical protein [Limnohabitans sp. B9-3]|uniref:hypothetical protein n=1 Tax=Limnohabitans sp. B9-3 TaxID=1100707 RepID=UPI000C1F2CE1|nr:hypothetical protein [Limnohabitans sp. B9-3]PIT77763.1 hypothetical protein B9Z42_04745 [Limnohabitans sp. B9-3]